MNIYLQYYKKNDIYEELHAVGPVLLYLLTKFTLVCNWQVSKQLTLLQVTFFIISLMFVPTWISLVAQFIHTVISDIRHDVNFIIKSMMSENLFKYFTRYLFTLQTSFTTSFLLPLLSLSVLFILFIIPYCFVLFYFIFLCVYFHF